VSFAQVRPTNQKIVLIGEIKIYICKVKGSLLVSDNQFAFGSVSFPKSSSLPEALAY